MREGGDSEAKIHFELHRHLQNAIESGVTSHGVTFARSEPEHTKNLIGGQSADIVVFDRIQRPWLVIEAKKKVLNGYTRNFDPYSPKVIQQALGYAQQLRTPFFATYNGDILVLFKTFEEFKPLLQSKTKSYRITDIATFASSLLTDIIELYHEETKWDNLDDAFVARVKHFHERITPLFLKSLKSVLSYDEKFRKALLAWAKEQGFEVVKKGKEVKNTKAGKEEELTERANELIAVQASYILVNQILFYKILENSDTYKKNIQALRPVRNLDALPKVLEESFQDIINNIDFKAVYEHDEIFSKVRMIPEISEIVNDFIEELEDYDLTVFDSDIIGRIYENLIPSNERHDLGQYYTPPAIAELIVRLCIKKKNDTVLDPSCGSGGFLVKAYRHFKKLCAQDSVKPQHETILKHIFGIDINKFPAHLSAINLAIQDISSKTDCVQIEVADFFDINVGQGRFARKTASITGEQTDEPIALPNKVNVVVANPPYIRQEKISDKGKVRKHIPKNFKISKRADIYVYFFTHSAEFLEEGGTLGFITSDRWLDTEYGEDLQKFFLDRFKIRAILKFDKQAFEEPLIGSVVTILEKESRPLERDKNVVILARIKENMTIEGVLDLVETQIEQETILDTKAHRLVAKRQETLTKETKWNRYLYAPSLYFELISSKHLTVLESVANIEYGCKTGANEFFYLKKEDIEALGLDPRFFRPLMKAIAQAKSVNFRKNDTEWFVLDTHDLVEEIIQKGPNQNEDKVVADKDLSLNKKDRLASYVKKKLQIKNINLYNYILAGEEKEYHERPTCKSRKIWFDLGDLPRPPYIFPDVYWKETSVPYNADKIVIDKQLYMLSSKRGVDSSVLGGILNSDWLPLFREMHGRTIMGEGMNRNQVMVHEAKQLPIPDPRKFTKAEANRIAMSFEKLLHAKSSSEAKMIKTELNKAVLATIEKEKYANLLEAVVQQLIDIRIKGGGEQKEIMIEKDEPQLIKLKGAEVISHKTLDEFTQT